MIGKEASDIIEEAINRAIQDGDDYDPGDIITDWVLIAYCVNPDSEKGGVYPRFVSNGLIPEHALKGLLLQALIGEIGE